MVRKSGAASAMVAMKSARSRHALAIFRDEWVLHRAIPLPSWPGGSAAGLVAPVACQDDREVQFVPDHCHNKPAQMIRQDKIMHDAGSSRA
jgi:hypothetical protein